MPDLDEQTKQHRAAYNAVMTIGAELISHEDEVNPGWEQPMITGLVYACPVCGDPNTGVSLAVRCRDMHEVCKCGARYDQPKNPGCRRRKHPKEEK